MQGKGCGECRKIGALSFKERANIKHNNAYSYENVIYVNNYTKVKITCSKHGDFEQMPKDHLNGHRCPKCCRCISNIEMVWLDTINVAKELHQKTLNLDGKIYKVDAFDSSTNTVYEFYGDYWHGNPQVYTPEKTNPVKKLRFEELYRKTIDREKELIAYGYNVVSIWENDFQKILKGKGVNLNGIYRQYKTR